LQKRLGGDRLFCVGGRFQRRFARFVGGIFASCSALSRKRTTACCCGVGNSNPADCLKALLALPVRVENVTLKRPSLNDVFLQ